MAHGIEQHTSDIRARVARLVGLGSVASQADENIRRAAEHRLAIVQAEIDDLRTRALLDTTAADQYQDRILERGRLERILAS